MSDIAIRVENLGKRYRLGQMEPYRTLRESLMGAGRRLFHRLAKPQQPKDDPQDLWALKDVSFEVKQGEVVGIIGRNGAGKSTLLKILSRITEPTTGRAELNGRVGSLLEVGTGFHPELTGRENIYLNGAILGMTRAEIKSKFDEIVAFSEVEKFIDTPVKRYSSGMYVRLAFAVAAHLEPEILVVDEVLAVGDQAFQNKCIGKMSNVAQHGRTVLFVSHNMAAVEALCGKAVLLREGRLSFHADTQEVIQRYMQDGQSVSCDFDLFDHKGRLPGRNVIARRLRLTDDSGQTLSSPELGRPVTFELTLASDRPRTGVAVAVHIYSSIGQRVVSLHSRYQYAKLIAINAETLVRCRMSNCQLMPGTYSIVLGVDSGSDNLDRIESGLQFEVLPRDVYDTGRLPPARDGVYVPDAEWSQEAIVLAHRGITTSTIAQ